jgi:hypothetical protein
LPVQRVILTGHEQPLNLQDPKEHMLIQRNPPAADTAAAAGGSSNGNTPAAAVEPPGSPSEEGLLAALAADADLEEGELPLPPPEQLPQPPQQQKGKQGPQQVPQQQQEQYPAFKNLFGPLTVSGCVLRQYNSMDHFCQLPLASAIAQASGKQAAAAKQGSGSRRGGLLALLQQRGLELRWTPELLSCRSDDWLLQDHEQVRIKLPTVSAGVLHWACFRGDAAVGRGMKPWTILTCSCWDFLLRLNQEPHAVCTTLPIVCMAAGWLQVQQ